MTSVLRLRPTTPADVDRIVAAELDPVNARFVGQWNRAEHLAALADPDVRHMVCESESGPVGSVILRGLARAESVELKRLVITEKDRGYGRQALQSIAEWVFSETSAHRLWLDVKLDNPRARYLYRTFGFRAEGTLRRAERGADGFDSLLVMSILASEWARRDEPLSPDRRPTIGLLAGMGVDSTAPFIELLVDECRRQYGAHHQADFPQIVTFCWPTAFRPDRPPDHDLFENRVREGLNWLERTGVDLLAMAANTTHLYFDALRRDLRTPLLNLVAATAAAVPEGVERVALLATRATRDSRLYHRSLAERGLETIAPETVQEPLDRLLVGLARGEDRLQLKGSWLEILAAARNEGAQLALLACTDLNVLFGPDDDTLPVLDGSRAMAAHVVEAWLEQGGGRVS